ncbi:MAG: hypothetical protein KAJ01_07205, partial [Candidatus Hydrogenedentes bacterium]|nr:hypothetical protein [Candidatus Hydrogenedentota bacterium]
MRHKLSLFVIMAILSLVSSVAYGFRLIKTGDDFVPLRWLNSDLPVGYRINGQNDDMTVQEAIDTITDSFATWGAVGSSSATSSYDGTTTDGGFDGSDDRNTISFDDPDDDLDSSILAITWVWFYLGSDGNFTVPGGRVFDELTDADIVFNDDDFAFVPGNRTPADFIQYDP